MRHRISGKKLGRDESHRKALLRGLSISLVEHGSVTTTLAKAKYVKPFFEKLITRARTNNQLAVRELRKKLANEGAVRKLMAEVAPKFAKRPGGYTRIVKLGVRDGDNAEMAKIELIQVKEAKPATKSKATKKSEAVSDPAEAPVEAEVKEEETNAENK